MNKRDNNNLINKLILLQKDFHLLPRDENGICTYYGYLEIDDYDLNILPDNLLIDGYLKCNNNNLVNLPDNLVVNGSLYCDNNKLAELPDNLVVKGWLDCKYNDITELPSNLIVKFWLDCRYNQITKKINSKISNEIYMDDEQKRIYDRIIKIDYLKEKIDEQ